MNYYFFASVLFGVVLARNDAAVAPSSADPIAVSIAVATALTDEATTFINWEGGFTYGGAIVADGVYTAAGLIAHANPDTAAKLMAVVNGYLDKYMLPPTEAGTTDCSVSHVYSILRTLTSPDV